MTLLFWLKEGKRDAAPLISFHWQNPPSRPHAAGPACTHHKRWWHFVGISESQGWACTLLNFDNNSSQSAVPQIALNPQMTRNPRSSVMYLQEKGKCIACRSQATQAMVCASARDCRTVAAQDEQIHASQH